MRIIAILTVLAAGLAPATELEVANPDLLARLTEADRAVLAEHGLAAQTTDFDQIYEIYTAAADDDLPVLVTTDPLFHVFHILYDYSLRTAELDHFYPTIQLMLEALLTHQTGLLSRARDAEVKQALECNIAYLSVPLAYLDSGFEVPASVAGWVKAEQRLIEAHVGFDSSEVLGIFEDFSQYKPRGHYTRNEEFRRYFKAMMYLGRMTFLLKTPKQPEVGMRLTRQAILLADAFEFNQGGTGIHIKQLWNSVYEPTAYLVGEAEDPLPHDYDSLFSTLAGRADVVEWVAEDNNIAAFVAKAESLPQPRILSGFRWDDEPVSTTNGMRLMSQRYIPDSEMFQRLVYTAVGTQGKPRCLPMGLDVMAVLGSARARELLIETYHQDTFYNYLPQLDSLCREFAALTPEEWNQNAYYGWLHALKLNLEPVGLPRHRSFVARFTQSVAYADKTLVTSCGSWAELRHDTILYAKQSYTVCVGVERVPEPPKHIAYVEPKPEVFSQLARLAKVLKEKIEQAGNLHKEIGPKLDRYVSVTERLADIAEKEYAGTELSERDAIFCKYIGGDLKRLSTFSRQFGDRYLSESKPPAPKTAQSRPKLGEEGLEPVEVAAERPVFGVYTNEDERMALVADVHTDPNTGLVLQEAVGNPCKLYAVIPFYGKRYLAVGACFSYYEFTKPMSERMTDAEWQAMHPRPAMPVWTESFITR